MPTIQAVLFDVDGTLIDSNDLHAEAWAEVLAGHGHPVPVDVVRGQIGKGGDNLMPALLPASVVAEQGEAIEEDRGALFKRDYLPRVRPFPCVRELFERLKADGKTIVIASSGAREEVEHHLETLGVADLIDGGTSKDDVAHSKPAPDIFAAALDKAGVGAEHAVVVGDTPYDIEAAAKIGLPTIAVRAGGFPEEELARAAEIRDDIADLLANYDTSLIGR